MTDNISINASLGTYGVSFQEKIVQALLGDPPWAEQMMEVFKSTYLDKKYLQFLTERYFAHAAKYKIFPTLQLLVTIIRDELKTGTDGVLREQIIDYLQRIKANPSPGDLPYVKDKALDFCRKQALRDAIETSIDMMKDSRYDEVAEVVKKAVTVGTTPSMGHDFFADYDARFTRLNRRCVPTGIPEFDKKEIFDGGLGAGELGVVVAPTGVGKCVIRNTYVHVRHEQITINGKTYNPWDRIETSRGTIYARDIRKDDELT